MTPVAAKKLIKFDTKTFLSTINDGRKIEAFPKKQTIFAQGDSSDAVFYIQEGKVKLTVVSQIGKEATIGILNKGDFFGEGCLTGQPLRLCQAGEQLSQLRDTATVMFLEAAQKNYAKAGENSKEFFDQAQRIQSSREESRSSQLAP
jgi:CRP/FNR family cyclic AMP-dependent transcriptional regulator